MNNAPVENPFFRWVRGLGVQRSSNRWIGGVAGGLGQRFGIDPILARGIVLVLAVFTGVGLLLYGLAWALLPEPDGRIHAQEAGRGRWTSGMTGALVFFLLGTFGRPGPFDGWSGDGRWNSWWGGTFWVLAIIGGAIWFSVARGKRRGDDPVGNSGAAHGAGPGGHGEAGGYPASGAPFPSAPSGQHGDAYRADAGRGSDPSAPAEGTHPGTGAASADSDNATAPIDAWGGTYPTTPIDTSTGTYPTAPIGSAPSGYGSHAFVGGAAPRTAHAPGGPSDALRQQTPERTGNPLPGHTAAIVLGVAILVAGTTVLASMLGWIDLGGHAAAVALAAALTVVGFGLVGAALRRHSGGALTGFAIALLVPTLVFGGAAVNRSADARWFGPVQVHEGNEYTYVFSDAALDLSPLGEDLRADTAVTISNVFSSLDLTVPDNVPVVIHGDSAFYSMEVATDTGTTTYSGIGSDDGVQVNPDATGPTLTIEINGAFNSVDVATKEVAP